MLVEEVLKKIISQANLPANESIELEKAFFEIVNLKIIKSLGESLSIDQQIAFTRSLEGIKTNQDMDSVVRVLDSAGINSAKSQEIIDQCLKQAFREILNLLSDRLSPAQAAEINELLI